ncbi:hypothetical protein CIPAW_09G084200 [Carya illinoinensis]|uniref:Uncharacterized protein n=1 Tax=Carya illinoinensis TaxID=32201 RepID=A0A8T1PKJ2_CARIL|nr:hypothetical protein CIPAW_09G084200 [Carya illinoinensis]
MLPKRLCTDINALISKFRWKNSFEGKTIYWRKWSEMGENNVEGGMGFREIEVFNRALLAKQGKLQMDQDSLVAKVVKDKYFKRTQFIEAKLGVRPSYMWRSLMAAQSIVKDGLTWRVGNGKRVAIWHDEWIPQPVSHKVRSPVKMLSRRCKGGKIN